MFFFRMCSLTCFVVAQVMDDMWHMVGILEIWCFRNNTRTRRLCSMQWRIIWLHVFCPTINIYLLLPNTRHFDSNAQKTTILGLVCIKKEHRDDSCHSGHFGRRIFIKKTINVIYPDNLLTFFPAHDMFWHSLWHFFWRSLWHLDPSALHSIRSWLKQEIPQSRRAAERKQTWGNRGAGGGGEEEEIAPTSYFYSTF